jgi:hypothetical protein
VLINGFNSWWTGFGSGGTTLITAGMIINGAIFFEISQLYSGNSQKVFENSHMNLDGRWNFFQVFSVADFFSSLFCSADKVIRKDLFGKTLKFLFYNG